MKTTSTTIFSQAYRLGRLERLGRLALAVSLMAMVTLPIGSVVAQEPVDVPVTFYDFRSDVSNPEFEQPHRSGVRRGYVENTLDKDKKPVATRANVNDMNQGVRFWFRDWNNLSRYEMANEDCPVTSGRKYLEKFRPIYMYGRSDNGPFDIPPASTGQTATSANIPTVVNGGWSEGATAFMWDRNAYGSTVEVGGRTYSVDTAFKNVVIPGTLRFTYNASCQCYEFSRTQSRGGSFFPINNQGFGSEGRSNNFSFTMEMEYPFTHEPGMSFRFSGDDDVWVFINDRLALDLGGIHSEETASFNVDDIPGVNRNGQNFLRVFYAERHTNESNILIQTNIIAAPGRLDLIDPDNGRVITTVTKNADEEKEITIKIYDKNGNEIPREEINCDNVVWKIDGREVGKGCEYTIADSVAGTINISATYTGKDGKDDPVTNTATMQINPLEPVCIFIQATATPKDLPTDKNGVIDYKGCGDTRMSDDIIFDANTSSVQAYAILRDKYGNPVPWNSNGSYQNSRGSFNAEWTSTDKDVATVSPESGAVITVSKEAAGEGSEGELFVSFRYTSVPGTDVGPLRDTVMVGSKREPGGAVGPNPFVPGVDNVKEYYGKRPNGDKFLDFYERVIDNSGAGQGNGVLISIDAPKRLQEIPNGKQGLNGATPYARIMIYDAVGNIVHIDYAYQAKYASTYGYVWDGKNKKGRYVGPGTYLARIAGKDADGNRFSVQKKIGVTKR